MIKDMMVRLDSSAADELRLAAGKGIADVFDSQVIALFLNVLPVFGAAERDGIGATQAAELMRRAREGGDRIEAELLQRLARLQMRRFDDFSDGDIRYRRAGGARGRYFCGAAPERRAGRARTADRGSSIRLRP